MTRCSFLALAIALLSLFLFSCSTPFYTPEHKDKVCKELKNQIIFNGATSNTRRAEIENAQQPLLQNSYNDDCK